MKALGSLKLAAEIWKKLSLNGNSLKPQNKFIFSCPCCEYVFNRANLDKSLRLKNCIEFCPIKWPWDNDTNNLRKHISNRHTLCHSSYYDWVVASERGLRKIAAGIIYELILKSIEELKQTKK